MNWRPSRANLVGIVTAAASLLLPISPDMVSAQTFPPLTITAESTLGGIDAGLFSFQRILDVARTADGRLYLVQLNVPEIIVIEPDGSSVSTLGRSGSGPGEFLRPSQVGIRGDSIWVGDAANNRLTLFTDAHEVARILTPRPTAGLRDFMGIRLAGFLRDGTVFGVPRVNAAFTAERIVENMPLLRLSDQGQIMDTITSVVVGNSTRAIYHPAGRTAGTMIIAQRLADDPIFALTADGGVVVVERPISDGRTPAIFSVRKYAPTGEVEFDRSFRYTPVAVPNAYVDSVTSANAESIVEAGLRNDLRSAAAAVRSTFFFPRYYPPVVGAANTSDGRIWLRLAPASKQHTTWLILSPHGDPTARVDLPPGHIVMESGGGQFWTMHFDELEIPYLTRFDLGDPQR